MRREITLRHQFVEHIPEKLEEGVVYVSITFATAAHKCCCGCGNEVVTPLSPSDWKLTFDGQSVSLDPSIGNWGFACRSHYWIRRNKITWAAHWSPKQVAAARALNAAAKGIPFDAAKAPASEQAPAGTGEPEEGRPKEGFWQKMKKLFS